MSGAAERGAAERGAAERGGWKRAARLLRPDLRADVDEELRFHLEMRARELEAEGLDPATASTKAVQVAVSARSWARPCGVRW